VDSSAGQVGNVFAGIIPFEIEEHRLDTMPKVDTKIMVNIGSPDDAFKNYALPAEGVGLGRLEFIIASHIRLHPNVLINYKKYVWKYWDKGNSYNCNSVYYTFWCKKDPRIIKEFS
jgi:pyruvate,water dikinase